MRRTRSGQPVILATLSLLACGGIGVCLAFIGVNGQPEELAAMARENNGLRLAAIADATPQQPRPADGSNSVAGGAGAAGARQLAQSSEQVEDSSGKQFNDWTIRCQKNEAGAVLGCEAFQRLSVRDTGQRFLELAVGYPQGGETPLAIFVLPLGLWLPPGMDFQIDNGEPLRTPIQRCIQGGCLVQIPLTTELLSQMKQGERLAIQVYRQKDDPIAVPISLIGFTAALEEIKP